MTIIDTDVGFDDLLAILLLLSTMRAQIRAFTVVQGESDPHVGAQALLSMQEQLGFDTPIPVYIGSHDQPNHFPNEKGWFNQVELLGWPAPKRFTVETDPASVALAPPAGAARNVIAIGPLTNIAAAMRAPASRFNILAMGGTWTSPGNMPVGHEVAEANFWVDPPSAAAVCAAATDPHRGSTSLVTLDACEQVPIDAAFIAKCRAAWNPPTLAAKLALEILALIEQLFLQKQPPEPYFAYDPLVAAAFILTDVVTGPESGFVAVDATTGHCTQIPGVVDGPTVYTGADAALFAKRFIGALSV